MPQELQLYRPASTVVRLYDKNYAARLAREYTDECIEALVDMVRNGDNKERIVAANSLLDRAGYPKNAAGDFPKDEDEAADRGGAPRSSTEEARAVCATQDWLRDVLAGGGDKKA